MRRGDRERFIFSFFCPGRAGRCVGCDESDFLIRKGKKEIVERAFPILEPERLRFDRFVPNNVAV